MVKVVRKALNDGDSENMMKKTSLTHSLTKHAGTKAKRECFSEQQNVEDG